MITIHANYRTNLWHPSESGPAAVISRTCTIHQFGLIEQCGFGKDLFSGGFNTEKRCDFRCGFLNAKTAKRVLIVSTKPIVEKIVMPKWLQYMRVRPLVKTRKYSSQSSLNQVAEFVAHFGIEVIMIPKTNDIFPSWPLRVIAKKLTFAAFGGESVFEEEELRRSPKPAVQYVVDEDSDDDEGEEWKVIDFPPQN